MEMFENRKTIFTLEALLLLLLICSQRSHSFPHDNNSNSINDDPELVVVEEIVHYKDASLPLMDNEKQKHQQRTDDDCDGDGDGDANVESSVPADDNESVMMASTDDLIFLARRPPKTNQQQNQLHQQQNHSTELYRQIDLFTSDELEDVVDSLASSSASLEHGVPREIELRTDHDYTHAHAHSDVHGLHVNGIAPIDMDDFLALIPANEVKAIVDKYYRNDPEVQRAYAFMCTPDFAMLRQHVIAVPEMAAFLRYLNSSGLDVVAFVYTLTNLTNNQSILTTTTPTTASDRGSGSTSLEAFATDLKRIENIQQQDIIQPTTTTTTEGEPISTTMREQLNGLHGLVDSILDVLPQDQILATFFDKLETSEQFSRLVDRIGSPAFASILNDLQNSVALRNLIFTLHNNGIYVTRIVDSLKAYFFLGTF